MVVYVLAGGTLGGVGASIYGVFDHASAYLALRWAAAVALGWIGFSVARLAPSLAGIDRFTAPVTVRIDRMRGHAGATLGARFFPVSSGDFCPAA